MQSEQTAQYFMEEDEIDLRELFLVIKKNFWKIVIFVFFVVLVALCNALSKPNIYESKIILAPQSQSQSPSLGGGLGALAGMAGIDIGRGGEVSTYKYLDTILKDYEFNEKIIKKHNLEERLKGSTENYVFAFGFRGMYDLLHGDKPDPEQVAPQDTLFDAYKTLMTMLSFTSDKQSSIITLAVESPDRFLAKELVEIYLSEATSYLRELDMEDTEQKIAFYREEMMQKDDVELKKNLAALVSSLIQKSVLSKSSPYYLVKPITNPQVAHVKNKTKPKRSLILVVSFVTAFILGIFIVFFLEFLKNNKDPVRE